ncbi:MAG: penicillin-binding protein 2 [Patescibacteria group bacterium]
MFDFPPFRKEFSRRVLRSFPELEPQEVFLDKLAQEREAEGLREQQLEVPLSRTFLLGLYGVFLLVAGLFLFKVALLQIGEGGSLAEAAQDNAIRSIPEFPERGVVYDAYGEQLVSNEASFDLLCDKRDAPQDQEGRQAIFTQLASLSGELEFSDVRERFEEGTQAVVVIQKNLSYEEILLWETKREDIPGCEISQNTVRRYKDGSVFAHLLGYTANISPEELTGREDYFVGENVGKMGVELSYERYLRGEPGMLLVERDAHGRAIGEKGTVESELGKSVVLWADADLQRQAAQALQRSLEATGTSKGAVVALDPQTGGVLALVSFPAFDPNLFSGGIEEEEWRVLSSDENHPMFNRALSGNGYPTGSAIKPLVALAALEEGVIREDTVFTTPLELCVPHQYTQEEQCFRDWTYHGSADVRKAIAQSVNPFFYIIGGGHPDYDLIPLGPTRLLSFLELFGWGKKTSIDLPAEGNGVLPILDENWRLGDTYHLSIGQGPFAVPPLQVASAFVAFANGGTLYAPQVVRQIVDERQRVLEEFQPRVLLELPVSQENLRVVREGMRQTVTAGSATGFLNSLPVAVAAKTGTAQTGRKDWQGQDFLYSWTVAFAPYENPEIVLVALVEDAKADQASTLPIVRDVFQWYFNR